MEQEFSPAVKAEMERDPEFAREVEASLHEIALRRRFLYHPPMTDQRRLEHELVRANCLFLAEFIDASLPEGREKSLALTKLEEVMFWANAALARQSDEEEKE